MAAEHVPVRFPALLAAIESADEPVPRTVFILAVNAGPAAVPEIRHVLPSLTGKQLSRAVDALSLAGGPAATRALREGYRHPALALDKTRALSRPGPARRARTVRRPAGISRRWAWRRGRASAVGTRRPVDRGPRGGRHPAADALVDDVTEFFDSTRHGVWVRSGRDWTFHPGLPSVEYPPLEFIVHISPDAKRAIATVRMGAERFGPRFVNDGGTWRVTGVENTSIS